jgi:hypothetical protein
MTLPNGTKVDIEGTTEEVAHLLATVGQAGSAGQTKSPHSPAVRKKARRVARDKGGAKGKSVTEQPVVEITAIVNAVKNCDEADAIEEKILDKTSQVDRTLLPLYVMHEYIEVKQGLTSGDINRVTTQLGIPISTANASSTLSGTASRYVMADSVRKKGVPVRYTLSRKGTQYMKGVLAGQSDEVKE